MRARDIQEFLAELRPAAAGTSRQEWVVRELRRVLRLKLRSGDRLPPVRALQVALGVSGPTVRAGQALLARDGLIELRHGSGAYVTPSAAELRVAIVSELNLLHPGTGVYFRGAADAARRELADRGARAALYIGHYAMGESGPEPSCAGYWEDAAAGRLDGAILLNLPKGNVWPERVRRSPIPVVGTFTDSWAEPHSEAMLRDALRALQAAGCRRCAFIGWGELGGVAAFHALAGELGLEIHPRWTKTDLDPAYPGSGWAAFRELWAAGPTKPDGLVILDDTLFADAQLAIMELGIQVPEQLRIVTQTNRGAPAQFRVPALALEVDPADAGVALVQLLLARIAGDTEPHSTSLPYRLRHVSPSLPPTLIPHAAGRT